MNLVSIVATAKELSESEETDYKGYKDLFVALKSKLILFTDDDLKGALVLATNDLDVAIANHNECRRDIGSHPINLIIREYPSPSMLLAILVILVTIGSIYIFDLPKQVSLIPGIVFGLGGFSIIKNTWLLGKLDRKCVIAGKTYLLIQKLLLHKSDFD